MQIYINYIVLYLIILYYINFKTTIFQP